MGERNPKLIGKRLNSKWGVPYLWGFPSGLAGKLGLPNYWTYNADVLHWPTPTTQEVLHENMTLNEKGRRLSKDGKNSHSLNLQDRVHLSQKWRTPTTMDGKSRRRCFKVRN